MATLTLVILGWPVPSAAADWPHLRGPNYDGVATEIGLADAWPAEGPPRLWVRELGQGHSGFIVAEGKVFTQRQALGGQYLLCVDPESGRTLWETQYDGAWQPKGAYPGPYASPTYYRGKIYYASPSSVIGCMDAKDGTKLWSLNVRDKFSGKGYGFGYAATPLVEDNRVILPVGGQGASMVALHADDGRTLWTTGSDPASYCPALPITFQGRRCVVGYLENAVVLVDAVTGEMLHRQALSTGYDEHSAWPLYQEPHLLLTGPFRVAAARLQLQAGPDHGLLCLPNWTSRQLCNDIVSSVLFDGHIYGFDLKQAQASKHRPSRGTFKCLDWPTGKACWETDQVGQASVLVADGKLLLVSDEGSLILAKADSGAYQELGRTQLFDDEICWTPPTLWQGRLFVRSPSQAISLYVGRPENKPTGTVLVKSRPGKTLWHFDAARLISREREYPNDAFSEEELTLWFGACVAILACAALLTWLALRISTQLIGVNLYASPICWSLVFVLGFLGPNLGSIMIDNLLFTWLVAVYAGFHATLLAYSHAGQRSSTRRGRWLARLLALGLLLICLGYYELCLAGGMFVAWSFLFGLLPCFPLTYLAARSEMKKQKLWMIASWILLAFSGFYWICPGFIWWKSGLE